LSTDTATLIGMAKTASAPRPFSIVIGGDAYLNDQTVHDMQRAAVAARPDAELIELNAGDIDQYTFDEAVSPSLLSDVSIVTIVHLQQADERLGDAMIAYCKQAVMNPATSSIVIAQHEGGVKGKRLVDQLVKAGAVQDKVPDLKKADARMNFVMQTFEREHRRVDPMAAQQLVSILGDKTGELAAMCRQLCFDFDDDPIAVDRVDQYLTTNPQVTGFNVADKAISGNTAQAIIAMRSAIEQGTDPIALIGALAMKLRTIAKASAVRAGMISQAEAKTNPWVLKNAMRQLSGWTSQGLGACIQMLAWADEQSKTNGGDPVYALERSIELISSKGRNI
jgi:DNA polymerase-3 subunit delta